MQDSTQPLDAAQIAAALDWWREAGVDLDFLDESQVWLVDADDAAEVAPPALPASFVAPRKAQAATVEAAEERIGGDRAGWPADLDGFKAWWLAEPSLDGGQVRDRIAPRGPRGAQVMVIVPDPGPPEPGQDDSEVLLSGREGSLLLAMLGAMNVTPDEVYFASALPRHTPLPDWEALRRQGLGEVLAHHIALVSPRRLVAFGSNILPLLGHDPAQIAATSLQFNQEGLRIGLLGALDLSTLASRPARKAAFWQRWLDFSGLDFSGSESSGT